MGGGGGGNILLGVSLSVYLRSIFIFIPFRIDYNFYCIMSIAHFGRQHCQSLHAVSRINEIVVSMIALCSDVVQIVALYLLACAGRVVGSSSS